MKKKLVFFLKSILAGFGFSIGVGASMLMAVTVSGAFNRFEAGETISVASINANFDALKNAIESIPDTSLSPGTAATPGGVNSGYIRVGDAIIQWGPVLCTTGGSVSPLPTAFTSHYRITASSMNDIGGGGGFRIVNTSLSTVTCTSNTSDAAANFIAVGY